MLKSTAYTTVAVAGVSWLARVRGVFVLVGEGFRVVGLYYPPQRFGA